MALASSGAECKILVGYACTPLQSSRVNRFSTIRSSGESIKLKNWTIKMKIKEFDSFMKIIAVIVLVFCPISIYHWVDGHPTNDDEIALISSISLQYDDVISSVNENDQVRRDKARENLKKIFDIHDGIEDTLIAREKIPPHFMIELYNTIADSRGATRRANPHDAKIVRSFIETDKLSPHLYRFNISGLETNESVIEAELHLHLTGTSRKSIPFTLRVYQVLESKSLNDPHHHRLLDIRYVDDVVADGWQVLDVTQAVLAWITGIPNLGLMVTASNNLTDHNVNVEFSREISDDENMTKQPILVLFNDDGKGPLNLKTTEIISGNSVYEPENFVSNGDRRNDDKKKNQRNFIFDHTKNIANLSLERKENYFANKREKKMSREEKPEIIFRNKREPFELDEDEMTIDDEATKFGYERQSKKSQPLKSVDIYESALWRQKNNNKKTVEEFDVDYRRERDKRSLSDEYAKMIKNNNNNNNDANNNNRTCQRQELYIDFEKFNMSSTILAPRGCAIYQCRGICDILSNQNYNLTNHAILQSTIHEMNLIPDVQLPCCVPTKLSGLSFLIFDGNDNVVLKNYNDIVVERCGCS